MKVQFVQVPAGAEFFDPASGESYTKTSAIAAILARPNDSGDEGVECYFERSDEVEIEDHETL